MYLDDHVLVNVEANRSEFKYVKRRNFIYMAKLYSMILNKGDNIKKAEDTELYQLNINARDIDIKKGEDIYELRSKYTNESLLDKFSILEKNVEYYRDLYYNKNENLTKSDYG